MSTVYLVDMVSRDEGGLDEKIRKLFKRAELDAIISPGDLVAVKIHFGEPGNHRLIHPSHIRVIVDEIKAVGGNPIIVDTTGIGLTNPRGTAVGCLEAAAIHGYTHQTLGAPLIVADGLKGFSGVKVTLKGNYRLKEVYVASVIAEADVLISIAHGKGHPRTGFAGAIKNLGVGCVTKQTKAELHLAVKPEVKPSKCDGCGICVKFCPVKAIDLVDGKAVINQDKCLWGCGCWSICPQNAITGWSEMHRENTELSALIAEAAAAVINMVGKEKVAYINMLYNITPHCDCFAFGDLPIVPDIGIMASRDPVAIDKASIDLVNQSAGLPGSAVDELGAVAPGADKFVVLNEYPPSRFAKAHGKPDWRAMLKRAVEIGLGRLDYRLIRVD